MRTFVSLFTRSPFGSLAEHAARVHEAVELLRPLFVAFIEGDWDETQKVYERISKLEHKADVLKNEIRDHLPKSLFLPVDRGDLLRFLKEQDGIADRAEDVAVLLVMRRTTTPPAMRVQVMDFVDYLISTSAAWLDAARELTILQEASFTGPEVEKAIQRAKDISDMEWEADKRQAALSSLLFEHETEIGAVGVVLWMGVLRELGGVANHAENTADMLRLMLAKR
jgi:predicted phosphate transport protein (TIGR00153 family)